MINFRMLDHKMNVNIPEHM